MLNLSRLKDLNPKVSGRFRAIAVTMLFVLLTAGRVLADSTESLIRIEAPPQMVRYSETIRSLANAAFRELNSKTRDVLLVPVTFVVAENREKFQELTGGTGENTLAVAFGNEQRVIINYSEIAKSASDRTESILVHELAHVYLEVKCQGEVPRWVHEGVAQYIAGEWPMAPGDASLSIRAYSGGLLPLRNLVNVFPAQAEELNLAYAQSLSVMQYLIDTDYSGSLPLFLESIRGAEGESVLKALNGGVALDALDLRWQDNLKSVFYVFTVVVSSGFFWGLASLLLVFAYFVKRKQSRALRRQWAREEAMAAENPSILDQAEKFDEDLAMERGDEYLEPEYDLEETPYDRYAAEKELAEEDEDWRR